MGELLISQSASPIRLRLKRGKIVAWGLDCPKDVKRVLPARPGLAKTALPSRRMLDFAAAIWPTEP